jgi:hypothetical protein
MTTTAQPAPSRALADTTVADDADALFEFGLDLLMRGLAAYQQQPGS